MISKQVISGGGVSDAVRYHDKAFSADSKKDGVDNYYANELATATWQGRGAQLLDMKDKPVTREQFAQILSGKIPDPVTGEIQDLSKAKDRRAGYDFTVAPPKSVSIVGLVGKDKAVIDAHMNANAKAMQWLERHGAVVRINQDGGIRTVKTGNLLWATVGHETNRSNEPQLHNHNVIAAVSYDSESGKWRSLTNDRIFALRTQADGIYMSELGRGLKKAGYELVYDKDGHFEIAGISRSQIESFSSRSTEMAETLKKWGIDPEAADHQQRQDAVLATRSKKVELSSESLHGAWSERAAAQGLNLESIIALARSRSSLSPAAETGLGNEKPTMAPQHQVTGEGGVTVTHPSEERYSPEVDGLNKRAALQTVGKAITHLSEREQSFERKDLEHASITFSRADHGIDGINWAIDQHMRGLHPMLKVRDPVPGLEDGKLWLTTTKATTAEISFVGFIQKSKDSGNTVLASEAEFVAALETFEKRKSEQLGVDFRLSREQRVAAGNILMHSDSVQGIQGDAGTGKTAALEFVREVAEGRGWSVQGAATSASAAQQLGADSGIKSDTIAGLFANRANTIKTLELEITELRASIFKETKVSREGASIEQKSLHAKTIDTDFGRNRYTFDHGRDNIFRSPDTLRQKIGEKLYAGALRGREYVAARSTTEEVSFKDKFADRLVTMASDASHSLARSMTSYEKVGEVEAIAARTALYLERDKPGAATTVTEFLTKSAELANVIRTGNRDGSKTLLVMDEASLTGAADTAQFTNLANMIGARVVLQGDTKQHSSVPAGRAFSQAQDAGMNTSRLTETRRFDKATTATQQAVASITRGDFSAGIDMLDRTTVDDADLARSAATRYMTNLQSLLERGVTDPKVGVVVLTNDDRKAINAAVHDELSAAGRIDKQNFTKRHLDDPKLTSMEQTELAALQAAGVNRLIFRKTYREIGVKKDDVVKVVGFDFANRRVNILNANGQSVWMNPERQDYFSPAVAETRQYAKGDSIEARAVIRNSELEDPQAGSSSKRVANGSRGVITAINDEGANVKWADGETSRLTNRQLVHVDHAYAHTSFKEQGATVHREIIAVSAIGAKVFNKEAAYVVASRAKDNTEIVTSDYKTMQENAGKSVDKTTATNVEDPNRTREKKVGGEFDPTVVPPPAAPPKEQQRDDNSRQQQRQLASNQQLGR